jgi:hypothetical protein
MLQPVPAFILLFLWQGANGPKTEVEENDWLKLQLLESELTNKQYRYKELVAELHKLDEEFKRESAEHQKALDGLFAKAKMDKKKFQVDIKNRKFIPIPQPITELSPAKKEK